MSIPLNRIARDLPDTIPFVAPEAIERRSGVPMRARIGANESSFGPSPKVIAAIAAAASGTWQYGDPEIFDLRADLSRHLGMPADNIVIGEGIDGLLGLLARLLIEPGDRTVTSRGAYPTFNYHVAGFGGSVVQVPYFERREDLENLAATAHRENARIVYLSNPDNPMGTWWSASEIAAFIDLVPETTLLILDEAYCETAEPGTLPPIDLIRPNLIRTRTFSKAYGLAGARVGYAIGAPEFVRAFNKVRNHFGVNRLGQIAARAALADQDYLHEVITKVGAGRTRIAEIAAACGLTSVPSATNFVAVDCGRDSTYALAVLNALEARGVFVRKPMARGLDKHIRISVGRPEELDLLAEVLPLALKDAS